MSELRAAGEEDLAVIHVGSARQHYGHSVFNGSVRASVRSETSCRCAFQRRDEWAPDLSTVAVTSPDKDRKQFFDLTQLRHSLTHHCQLVAGDLLDFAAMPAVL